METRVYFIGDKKRAKVISSRQINFNDDAVIFGAMQGKQQKIEKQKKIIEQKTEIINQTLLKVAAPKNKVEAARLKIEFCDRHVEDEGLHDFLDES